MLCKICNKKEMAANSRWRCDDCLEKNRNSSNKSYRESRKKTDRTWRVSRFGFKKKYSSLKEAFYNIYGEKCACCGEENKEFLTIEHIKGQKGQKKQSTYQAFCRAIAEHRPDLYKVLCMNCNHSMGKYGYCPHKK